MKLFNISVALLATATQTSCGAGVAQLADVIDRGDPDARTHLELQVKQAIFCELREGALAAREKNDITYRYQGNNVTSVGDEPLPDSWGAQVSFTLTADEKTTVSPGAILKYPRTPGVSNAGPVGRSFNFGFGGTLSRQNVSYDKYNTYWTAAQLTAGGPNKKCDQPPRDLMGPPSKSSPFVSVSGSGLGIADWLPGAVAVANFRRSSRAADNGEGPPLGAAGTSDTATYSNKFVIVTSGNITPTWTLVKVTANNSSLLDLNRTTTHELVITVGPGSIETSKDKQGKITVLSSGPSQAAINAQLAAQIGSAVAAAIKGQ